jgi:hypothetical protein
MQKLRFYTMFKELADKCKWICFDFVVKMKLSGISKRVLNSQKSLITCVKWLFRASSSWFCWKSFNFVNLKLIKTIYYYLLSFYSILARYSNPERWSKTFWTIARFPSRKKINVIDLCYRASLHGWSTQDFHSRCDDIAGTVVLIKVGNWIFGGYTDQTWQGNNYYFTNFIPLIYFSQFALFSHSCMETFIFNI